jgi:hypothetical protein
MSDHVVARDKSLAGSDWLIRFAQILVLLLPLALFYARAVAEIIIALLDVAFLAHCAIRGGWQWLRAPWVKAALAWWIWLVFVSSFGAAGMHGLTQAVVAVRVIVLAAALGYWALAEQATRRRLMIVLSVCAGWLVLQCWQQYLFGVNMWGLPRYSNGALTGPFTGLPRAGTAFVLFFFPVAFYWAFKLSSNNGRKGQLLAGLLIAFGLVTMVLIGQRMPILLTILGMVLMVWLLPEARRLALPALIVGALAVAATPIISPPTFHQLVIRFGEQLAHFPTSDYGLLYMRAIVILNAHPWFGGGQDAFRALCSDPAYWHGLSWLGVADSESGGQMGCNFHAHNFYLGAATSGGYPGLLLFTAMTATCVWTLARSAMAPDSKARHVLKLALLVQTSVAFWPLAAGADFLSVPNVGWDFLMLGWGLALSRADSLR